VASLLVVASGLVANRHKSATAKVDPPAFVSMMHP
jgi:hypothetical protein